MSASASNRVRAEFLGLGFDRLNQEEAVEVIFRLAGGSKFSAVVTPNVDHVVNLASSHDAKVRDAYDTAALCLCDSRILALLASWSKIDLPVIPGSDLTALVIEHPLLAGRRVALVGASTAALEWLQARRPDAEFVQWIPPLGVREDASAQADIIAFVERSACNIALFAIGAPQSELLAQEIRRRGLAQGVGLCIGASIDFLTGAKRRAPRSIQIARLEWAHRLVSEPSRLWRRYLVRAPKVFAIWWKWRADRANS